MTISDTPSQVEVQTVGGVSLTISDTGVTRHCRDRAGHRHEPGRHTVNATGSVHGQRAGDHASTAPR